MKDFFLLLLNICTSQSSSWVSCRIGDKKDELWNTFTSLPER